MQRNCYSAAQFYSGTRTVIDLRTLTLKPWCFKFVPKTVHSVHNRKFSACTSCFSFRCKFCGILGYIWPGSVLKTSDCLYVAKTETFGILNSSIVSTWFPIVENQLRICHKIWNKKPISTSEKFLFCLHFNCFAFLTILLIVVICQLWVC